jgi:hypothetical protein
MTNIPALASIQDAARILNVSTKTLRRWEARGVLVPVRTEGGHRRYDLNQIKELKGNKRHIRISNAVSAESLPQQQETLQVNDIPVLYQSLHIDQKRILKYVALSVLISFMVFGGARLNSAGAFEPIKTRVLGIKASNNTNEPEKETERQLGLVLAENTSATEPTFGINIQSAFREYSYFGKDVEIDGNLILNDQIIGNVDLTGVVIVGGNSITTGQSTFNLINDTATTLNIGGAATNVNIGSTSGITNINNNLTVDGTANVTGAATFGSTMAVTGATTIGGTLGVTGAITGSGNLNISGNTTLSGTASVTGKITGSGDLDIAGDAQFGDISEINGITYAFPSAQGGSDTFLKNNGSGTLTWAVPSITAGSITGVLPITNGGTNNSTAYSAGSVIFSDGTKLTQDNLNFFYDDTNNRLGIGNAAPTVALDVTGAGTFSSTLTASNGLTLSTGALNLTSTSGTTDLTSTATSGNAFAFTDTALTSNNSNLMLLTYQNANTGAGTTANGLRIVATGSTPSSGTNTQNLISLSGSTLGSNIFNGIYFNTGLSNYVQSANWEVTAAGDQTIASDLAVNGGDITTTQTTANIFNTNATTLNIGGAATTINIGDTNGTTVINGNTALGNSAGDSISFSGRVAQDSDLLPIGTTGTNDLGSLALPWDNVYGINLYQNGNAVCDASGANCPSGSTQYWNQANGTIYAISNSADILFGGNATSSAKFAFKNIASGTPTASISGSTANVATYLDGNGNLSTTNAQNLTLGSSTTGNVVINSRGSTALTANGTDITTGGTVTLPNSNTLTGVSNYVQTSGGIAVGGATTYYLDGSGNLSANAGTFAGNVAVNGGDLTTTQTTANLFTNATTLGIAAGSGTTTINNALAVSGNTTLGNAITDSLTFTGRVAQDVDLLPIGTTGTNDLGSASLPWDNIYAVNLYQNGNLVCDASGANCPAGSTQFWGQTSGSLYALNNTSDLLLGGSATASAKFAFTGVAAGTPTASISGSIANVATYINGDGNISTTNAQGLTLGSSTTGNVVINSRGSTALTANGANLTASGTLTLPNSNTLTGVSNYLQASAGISVGGGTTFRFDSSGNIVVNDASINGNTTLGDAITDSITLTGRVAQDSDFLPIGTTGTNDLGSALLPWDNIYANNIVQNGFAVCDASGANCPAAGSGGSKWRLVSGAVSPFTDSLDVLIGSTATTSAKFGFTNVASGTPTATISGSIANVATYIDGNGNLSTTNAQNLTLGSTTTGNVVINSRGSAALTANGANLTGTGTYTLPNSNTLTGVSGFLQNSGGYSVGGATTYYFNGSGNINANAGTFAGNVAVNGGDLTTTQTTANLFTNATTLGIGNASGTTTINGILAATGATTLNGNVTLGDAVTDTLTFTGRVAQDSDLLPIGTTGTNDIGSASLPWDNIYANTLYQSGNLVCDASGANCPTAGSGGSKWRLVSGALSPFSDTLDILVGATATSSAKIALTNIASGTPTATISGSITNVATYLDGNGNLSTTNAQGLTLGSSTTGNVVLNSRGSAALTANGANLTTTGTLTLPNTNTLTGVSNYLQASAGISVGGGTTYRFDSSGNIVVNDATFNGNSTFGDAITDSLTFTGRVAQDSDILPIGTTGTNDLGSNLLPWDNVYANNIYQNGSLVCDASGANCPTAGSGGSKWRLTSGAISPFTDSLDVLIGSTATTSAKFAFQNVASGTPTASISGSVANVATYLDGNGNLSTTNAQNLTVGSSTTGNVVLNSRGSAALTANGANLTTTGAVTLPNSNTLTGVSNYLQLSAGVSIGGGTTYYFDGSGNLNANAGTFAGALTGNGNITLGDAITDTITFGGRVAQDSDILPIGTTGTNDLGSASLPWDNVFATVFTQNGNLVCDASGTNCPTGTSGGSKWRLTNGAISPFTDSLDVLIGATATTSAKFAFKNVAAGTPTATISGSVANVATYLDGNGNLSTTNAADLTLGSSTTGNVIINSRGSSALTANGANLTTTGTFTLPNSNTLTGASNFLQASAGLSVGGATTYYFDASGNVNANAGTFGGALTANGNVTLGDATTDTLTFSGRVAQDSDLLPIGTTGTNDLGSASLPWDNVYGVNLYQNGNAVCDITGNCSTVGNYWQQNNKIVSPSNSTYDLAVGGTATGSAFQVFGSETAVSGIQKIVSTQTTTGDVLSATASGITSGNLVKLGTGGNNGNFTGNGIYMDFDNTGGNSFTGNFVKFDNAGSTRYSIDSTGSVTMAGTSLSGSSLSSITTAASLALGSTTSLTLGGNSTINGGTGAAGTLTLVSTTNGTKGNIQFFDSNNTIDTSGNLAIAGDLTVSGNDINSAGSGSGSIFNSGVTTLNIGGAATSIGIGAGSGTTTINNGLTVAGAALLNGNITLGNATTDTLTFTGRVAEDSDILPIGTTGTNDLGSASLPWDNVYSNSFIQNGFNVCDASGANCPAAGSGGSKWRLTSGAISPFSDTIDVLIGSTATTSAKFAFKNVSSGTPTASISGSVANVATYLDGNGNLSTTNAQDLTLGSSTTGNVVINSRGNAALTANGANLTTTGTLTLPNSNTLTGVSNYLQLSSGLSIGGATTYYFDGSGNINANAGTFAGALTGNGNTTLGDAITDTITFGGRVAQDSDLLPIGTTGTNDLGSASLPWDNIYGVAITQNGNPVCDTSGNCATVGNHWQLNSKVISPANSTYDLAIGGTATGSAFQVFGIEKASGNIAKLNSTAITTGNVFEATASAITSGNLIKLGTGGNNGNFTGNGIYMDFDNTGGNSFTGNFVKLDNAGSTKFTVDSNGSIAVAAGSGLDTIAAGTLALGTTTANAVSISKSGTTTTVNGALTSSETLTASNGLTLTTGALNLTSTSGTSSLTSTATSGDSFAFTNNSINTADGNLAEFNVKNNNTAGAGLAVNGISVNGTGSAPLSGTNTTNLINLGATALANNTFNGINFGSGLTNYINGTNFTVTAAGNVSALGGMTVSGGTINLNYTGTGNTNIGNTTGTTTVAGNILPATTNSSNLGSSASLQFNNIYANAFTQNGNSVCDTSGNCAGVSSTWQLNNKVISPANSTYDLAIGGTATGSAFQVFGIENTSGNIAKINSDAITTGNVFEATASAITSGNLVKLGTGGNNGNFTGNGIYMDFDNTGGNSFTGNFLKFDNAGSTRFSVDSTGMLSLANTETISNATNGTVTVARADTGALTLALSSDTSASLTTTTGDLTIDAAGGNVLISDPINVGGSSEAAYNYFSTSLANVSSPDDANDLFIQDELEVEGSTRFDITGGDNIIVSATSRTTTAAALDITVSNTTSNSNITGATLLLTNNVDTNAETHIGQQISVDNDANTTDDAIYGLQVENNSGSTADLDSAIFINNADTAQAITDALLIQSTGGGAITTGIDFDDTDIVTDIEFQNGETLDNNTDNTLNIGYGGAGGILLLTSATNSVINASTRLDLQADGAIDVNIAGGSSATGCTIANSTGNLTCAGALAINGNTTLGDAITDTITFTGRVAQDADLLPIGTTGTNDLGSASLPWDNIYAVAFNQNGNLVCDASGTNCPGAYWGQASGALYPLNNSVDLLLGATASTSAKFAFRNVLTGTPTASISGTTANVATFLTGEGNLAKTNMSNLTLGGSSTGNVVINSRGSDALTANGADLTAGGDLAVNGGDLTTSQTTATLFNTTATTLSLGGAATTALNIGNGTGNYTAINLGSGSGTHTINIAGTGATAADTINIGTGGTAADTINIGNSASTTALNLTSGTGAQTFASSVVSGTTTSSAFVFTGNSLTTGTGMYLNSSSITTGSLLTLNASSTTLTSGKLLDIQNNSSSVFSVGASQITSALPHQFTAAGDVTMAYDLVFTNQTASTIDSYGPLTLRAGESFENNDLTLSTYGTGNVILDPASTGYIQLEGATRFNGQVTLANDATPDVSSGTWFVTGGTTTITDFDAGSGTLEDGHLIVIESAHAVTIDCAASTEFDCGAADIVMADDDLVSFIYDSAEDIWRLVNWVDETDTQTGGADIAEYFPSTQSLNAGDVVKLDPSNSEHVIKSASAYESKVVGIVSTEPGITLGTNTEGSVPVALAGRVPVKISANSEAILPGDYLTSSTEEGKAMKATSNGRVIGQALSSWNPQSGAETVIVFINNTWYEPVQLTTNGDVSGVGLAYDPANPDHYLLTDSEGNIVNKLSGLVSIITHSFEAIQGTVDKLLVKTGLISPEVLTRDIKPLEGENNINITLGSATESGKLTIKDNAGSEVTSLDSYGNATFSGQINSENASISGALYASTIYADQIISKEGKFGDTNTNTLGGISREQIENLLKSVEEDQVLAAQSKNWNPQTATDSAMLNELNLKDLYVTGIAAFDSINVTNNVIFAGELAIAKLTNESGSIISLDTIDSPLSIQSAAAQPLYIMAGKVKIDIDGNMQVLGNLDVGGVLSASAINIAEDPNASVSGTILNSIATAGEGVVASGSADLTIINPNIKAESLLFVTPTSQTAEALFVKAKDIGSATVGFANPTGNDITFNWWIVNLINGQAQ